MAESTRPDTQGKKDAWTSLGVRTDIPHPARVYDYMLGGKDNFAADREMAMRGLQLVPEMLDSSRGNRDFLIRAVAFARDQGIRQFLDIGTGLPISPNTHEGAQQGQPDARVVYVDNDPVVFLRAEALMATDERVSVVRADLRDVDEVLARAGQQLDFRQPVALMFVAVLHCIENLDEAVAIAARYLAALAPGSYLVLSHSTDEFAPERTHQASAEAARRGATWVPRGKEDIRRLFNGLDLIEPGLVLVSYWRPDDGVAASNADRAWSYGGIARLLPGRGGACQVEEFVEYAADRGDRHGQVPGAGFQVDTGTGNAGGEPLAVRERDHVVLVALPDRDPAGQRVQAEPPVRGEREVVVPPAREAPPPGHRQIHR